MILSHSRAAGGSAVLRDIYDAEWKGGRYGLALPRCEPAHIWIDRESFMHILSIS
jgi:hypothetical protein